MLAVYVMKFNAQSRKEGRETTRARFWRNSSRFAPAAAPVA